MGSHGLMGVEFRFCKLRAVETDGGDGCTMCMFLRPLNCTEQ